MGAPERSPSNVRLFFGVDLDPAVRDGIAQHVRDCRERLGPDASRCTWVARDDYHITLAFLGERSQADVARVAAACERPLPVEPFAFEVGGFGAFPSWSHVRVVWAGVAEGAARVALVARCLAERVRSAGVTLADDRFHPHVTVARVRQPSPRLSARFADAIEAMPAIAGRTRMDHVTLFDSRAGAHGRRYVPLLRVTLCSNPSQNSPSASSPPSPGT